VNCQRTGSTKGLSRPSTIRTGRYARLAFDCKVSDRGVSVKINPPTAAPSPSSVNNAPLCQPPASWCGNARYPRLYRINRRGENISHKKCAPTLVSPCYANTHYSCAGNSHTSSHSCGSCAPHNYGPTPSRSRPWVLSHHRVFVNGGLAMKSDDEYLAYAPVGSKRLHNTVKIWACVAILLFGAASPFLLIVAGSFCYRYFYNYGVLYYAIFLPHTGLAHKTGFSGWMYPLVGISMYFYPLYALLVAVGLWYRWSRWILAILLVFHVLVGVAYLIM
jgi:hypothetical protein